MTEINTVAVTFPLFTCTAINQGQTRESNYTQMIIAQPRKLKGEERAIFKEQPTLKNFTGG